MAVMRKCTGLVLILILVSLSLVAQDSGAANDIALTNNNEAISAAVNLKLLDDATALRTTGDGMLQVGGLLFGLSLVPWVIYISSFIEIPTSLSRLSLGSENTLAGGITLTVTGGLLAFIGGILKDVGENRRIEAIGQSINQ